MLRILKGVLAVALATSCISDAAIAGQVSGKVVCFSTNTCTIERLMLTGEIDQAMVEQILDLIKQADDRTDKSRAPAAAIDYITLDSPGGSVQAAMAIGRLARQRRLTALVPRGAACISACVLIYAGAVVRNARTTGGRVGIHAPFLNISSPGVSEEAARGAYISLLRDIKSYLLEMNVSEQLADEMLKTPASQVRILDSKEQDRLGLVLMDPVEDEMVSLGETKRLGISRLEFNRRRTVVEKLCPNDGRFVSCAEAVFVSGMLPHPEDLSSFGIPVK